MATILYVEDMDIVREINKEIFECEGHTVIEAENGKQGADLFKQHAEKISVVITDLDMPEMSGDELVSVIREHNQNIPVFLTTGCGDVDRITKLLLKGATGCLEKPVGATQLLEIIPTIA